MILNPINILAFPVQHIILFKRYIYNEINLLNKFKKDTNMKLISKVGSKLLKKSINILRVWPVIRILLHTNS